MKPNLHALSDERLFRRNLVSIQICWWNIKLLNKLYIYQHKQDPSIKRKKMNPADIPIFEVKRYQICKQEEEGMSDYNL